MIWWVNSVNSERQPKSIPKRTCAILPVFIAIVDFRRLTAPEEKEYYVKIRPRKKVKFRNIDTIQKIGFQGSVSVNLVLFLCFNRLYEWKIHVKKFRRLMSSHFFLQFFNRNKWVMNVVIARCSEKVNLISFIINFAMSWINESKHCMIWNVPIPVNK